MQEVVEEDSKTQQDIQVQFLGSAREYFGIWIVNLLLSVLTFGIYSAWAKVRTKKYFLANTAIDNRSFDYHAKGLQILKGRAIVASALAVYSLLSSISLILSSVLLVVLLGALPWLINRGLRFNAAMTSWSNVRFRFKGHYWPAFRVFLLYPYLATLTFYLAFPFVTRAIKRYTIGGYSLGEHRFAFDSEITPFYKAFFLREHGPFARVDSSLV